MESKPLVTLSFPVFKGEDYLQDSLRSALKQNYTNIEYLIVDDKGSVGAMKMVKKILAKTQRNIRIVEHEVNLGQGFARNTSIDNARGEYIFFMDSDDVLSHDCISILVANMMNYDVEFVEGSSVSINGSSSQNKKLHQKFELVKNRLILKSIYEDKIIPSSFMWNKLYDLNFLRKNNIRCKHPYIEDFHFSFLVFCKAKSCVLLPNITYNYIVHSNSTTRTKMAGGISLKTLNIVSEIVDEEFVIAQGFESGVTREKALLDTLGFGLMYLYHAYYSSLISKEEMKKYAKIVLKHPKFRKLKYLGFSIYERRKHFFYRLTQRFPFGLRFFLTRLMNFPHYKKRGL